MENQPINAPNELYEALLGLLVRAKEGGLGSDLIQVLFSAVEKVMACSRKEPLSQVGAAGGAAVGGGGSNSRQSFRLVANTRGIMIIDKDRIPVEIHDISPQGFGLKSTVPVRQNTTVMLEAPSTEGGMDIFSCFVSYSKRDRHGIHVGLRIVDMLPRF